jgi:heme oxygenase
MPLRSELRAQTSDCHAAVDDIFGRFDLADPISYRAFLSAHARIVPAVEATLERAGIVSLLPDWGDRRRSELLLADLSDLGGRPPALLPAPSPRDEAELWGMAYVLEGSKIGGAALAKVVPPTLPSRYLTPHTTKNSVRSFIDRLDAAAVDDPSRAIEAARAIFSLFRKAAQMELEFAIS